MTFPFRFSYYATGLSDMEKVILVVVTQYTCSLKSVSKECHNSLLKRKMVSCGDEDTHRNVVWVPSFFVASFFVASFFGASFFVASFSVASFFVASFFVASFFGASFFVALFFISSFFSWELYLRWRKLSSCLSTYLALIDLRTRLWWEQFIYLMLCFCNKYIYKEECICSYLFSTNFCSGPILHHGEEKLSLCCVPQLGSWWQYFLDFAICIYLVPIKLNVLLWFWSRPVDANIHDSVGFHVANSIYSMLKNSPGVFNPLEVTDL